MDTVRKRSWAGLAFLLCALSAPAQPAKPASLQITELGLKGFYLPEPSPTRIQFYFHRGSSSSAKELRIQIYRKRFRPDAGHVFEFPLPADGQPTFSVPVLIPNGGEMIVAAEVRDDRGQVVASRTQQIEAPLYDQLVGIICEADAVCQAAQAAVSFSGSAEEKTEKQKRIRFVEIRQLPESAYAYSAVHSVIVAGSLSSAGPAGLRALEEYLRRGGRVILTERYLADRAWLSAYRREPPSDRWRAVGLGKLHRTDGIRPEELGRPFRGETLLRFLSDRREEKELPWARKRLATVLQFPSFLWLVTWLMAFMVAAGPFNFIVLRKMKKQEWGWVTTPSVAILFAVTFYYFSASSRPKTVNADAVTILWMDDRSSLAAAETGIRITTPRRIPAVLRVRPPGIFEGTGSAWGPTGFSSAMAAVLAGEMGGLRFRQEQDGAAVLDVRMLPWSFRDFVFRGPHMLPGTLEKASPGVIRNGTGLRFRQAIYVDKASVRQLGAMGPGAEVRLQEAKAESLESQTGRNAFTGLWSFPNRLAETGDSESSQRNQDPSSYMRQMEEFRALPNKPFSLLELIRGWPKDGGHAFDTRAALFMGLAETGVVTVELGQSNVARKNFVIVIVSLAELP